ncbi:MAG: urease accessory protein UreD [Gammaproteobacteria bacterium]
MYADRDQRDTVKVLGDSDFPKGWEAELKLGFVRSGAKTLMSDRRHRGPLTVQRPFYPEGGLCHVYVLHPPSGVVAGDRLAIDIHAACGAEALVTTPAAGKVYRSAGQLAYQTVRLKIDEGAVLEWLPQETIVYEGARLASEASVELAGDARFIGWEILALGRPASGEGFANGEALLNWKILRDGKPLYLEKMRLDAEAFTARWGLNRQSSCGTLFAYPALPTHLAAVRDLIGEEPMRAVTLIDDLLICRAVDRQAWPVRSFFEIVRSVLRSDIVLREDYAPRIWAT